MYIHLVGMNAAAKMTCVVLRTTLHATCTMAEIHIRGRTCPDVHITKTTKINLYMTFLMSVHHLVGMIAAASVALRTNLHVCVATGMYSRMNWVGFKSHCSWLPWMQKAYPTQ